MAATPAADPNTDRAIVYRLGPGRWNWHLYRSDGEGGGFWLDVYGTRTTHASALEAACTALAVRAYHHTRRVPACAPASRAH